MNLLEKGPIPYLEGDKIQRQVHAEVAAGQRPDTLILQEFEPTWTAGRRTKPQDIPDSSLPVIEMDRGGSVTWHGPGQLVCYPIVLMREPIDVVRFVRDMESGIRGAIEGTWQVKTDIVKGRSGVWILREGMIDRKICAIGVRTAQGTSMHGLALNVNPDLESGFGRIIPCGLADASVTSLAEMGVETTLQQVANALVPHLETALRRSQRVNNVHNS